MTVIEHKNELFVSLIEDDFGARKVVVCPQELELEPEVDINWLKSPESTLPFDFKGLVIAEPPFTDVEVKTDQIRVKNNAHIGTFGYTLIVTYDGQIYDTFQPVCEENCEDRNPNVLYSRAGDKPVIRPR